MSQDILMPHPDGSGRLIPHAIYASLKPQYDARRAAFDSGLGKYLETHEGRAVAREAFMEQSEVDRSDSVVPESVQPLIVPVTLFGSNPRTTPL